MKIVNLGYPRIGAKRELKKALEAYWTKKEPLESLKGVADELRLKRWNRQAALGVESIPLNDFTYYDHILDTAYLLGAIPKRFHFLSEGSWFDQYFAMARGFRSGAQDVPALDMTKWFNTNYHYLVPELDMAMKFRLQTKKLDEDLKASRGLAHKFHPVIVGPFTFVRLSHRDGIDANTLLTRLLPVYRELFGYLKSHNYGDVPIQIDEPALCLDLDKDDIASARRVYEEFARSDMSLILTTYFETPAPWLDEINHWPLAGMHLDLVHGKENVAWLKSGAFAKDRILSLGVVNGRNLWADSLKSVVDEVKPIVDTYGSENLCLAPSCSLLHLPHDKNLEKSWDDEFLGWVSFADQRLEELNIIRGALEGDSDALKLVEEREQVVAAKAKSPRVHRPEVRKAVEEIRPQMLRRASSYPTRIAVQERELNLPPVPTTTIGSFPQTPEIRKARHDYKVGSLGDKEYTNFLDEEIGRVIALQEKVGLDVLVHGEPERNDMVEYFGELLEGFQFSKHGWVQSYGSRCVKPPIVFGDVKRRGPMTVEWFKRAQKKTNRPMKGMLTGPVTMLNWSFVREDQPREKTAYQLGLAIREEVADLESVGAQVIQVDEAAVREGLPIKRDKWAAYLKWATESFRLCTAVVKDKTQIQTHMCYSEFSDIMPAVRELDADVLLIEFARSGPAFFETFSKFKYDAQVGPGVYDIHSPRVPTAEELERNIHRLLELFPAKQLWVNPDCGLKTRRYEEVEQALTNMVVATQKVRETLTH